MKWARIVLGGALALALVASTASADLIAEITLGNGTYDDPTQFGGQIVVTPGQTVSVELWSLITGGTGAINKDKLLVTVVRAFSSNGGAALVDFSNGALAYDPTVALGSQLGSANDLDGDGDLDWGGPPQPGWGPGEIDPVISAKWLAQRDGGTGLTLAYEDPGARPVPGGVGIPTAKFDLLVSANPGDWGVTEIWVQPDYLAEQTYKWYQGGTLQAGQPGTAGDPPEHVSSGPPLVLVMAATAAAPGGGAVVQILNDGLPVILDGSASTGSINFWSWRVDLDMNGDYETIIGEEDATSDGMLAVTYDALEALGLLPFTVYNAQLYVAYQNSPPVTESGADFQIEIVPEPATLALLGLGALALVRRKR